MEIPEFTPALVTGQQDIDDQHRRMFDAARQVLALRDAPPRALAAAVRFLHAYVHFHFAAEEQAMEAAGYDRHAHHVRQHALIRNEVEGIRTALARGGDPRKLLSRTQLLFQDWFVLHIQEVDIPFARFLRDHNATAERPVVLPGSVELVAAGRLDPGFEGFELPGPGGDLPPLD
jgi:hemerythrin-like metal-binding protein